MNASGILVARVAESATLTERLGAGEARHAIERCLKRVQRVTEANEGTVAACEGDEVLAEFDSLDAALGAAAEMHERVGDLPPVAGRPLRIRIGLHHDSATDLARALAEAAEGGQTLLLAESARHLTANLRAGLREGRPLIWRGQTHAVAAIGGSEPAASAPVVPPAPAWNPLATEIPAPGTTASAASPPPTAAPPAAPAPAPVQEELILRCGENLLQLAAGAPALQIGREKICEWRISDPLASRLHARIEWRVDGFVLIDESTNGTWISADGQNELALRKSEAPLRGKGRISFGHPAREGGELTVFLVKALP